MARWNRGMRYRTRVGIEEHRDPIPPGFYWVNSIDPEHYDDPNTVKIMRETYMNLLQTAFSDRFRIIRQTHHEAILPVPLPPGFKPRWPAYDWVLFEVSNVIPRWPAATEWGHPNIAPKGIDTQEEDTDSKTFFDTTFGDVREGIKEAGSVLTKVAIGLAVVVGGFVAYKVLS